MKRLIVLIALFMIQANTSHANQLDMSQLKGYTLLYQKTIEDDFEGCDFDRVIRFMDGTSLTCSSFSYTYSFMPTAYIYGKSKHHNGNNFVLIRMVVEDQVFDMYPLML